MAVQSATTSSALSDKPCRGLARASDSVLKVRVLLLQPYRSHHQFIKKKKKKNKVASPLAGGVFRQRQVQPNFPPVNLLIVCRQSPKSVPLFSLARLASLKSASLKKYIAQSRVIGRPSPAIGRHLTPIRRYRVDPVCPLETHESSAEEGGGATR